MPDQQQQVMAVLILAGLAGALLFVSMQKGRAPGGEPGPPPGPEAPPPIPLTPEQIAAYRGNGGRPAARAVPYYVNEETWELNRDAKGRLASITVHRQARVSNP